MKTTTEELVKLRKMYTFKRIEKLTGLSENMVKNRIYRSELTKVSTIKSKACNLTTKQKEKAASLHYFGYTVCEIVSETGARPKDVRIFISDLDVHPEFKKESA